MAIEAPLGQPRDAFRVLLEGDPMSLFRAGVASRVTRYHYERRMGYFLAWLTQTKHEEFDEKTKANPKWAEGLAKEFARRAKENPKWAEGQVLSYIADLARRVERGEIDAPTVKSYRKPLKLFLDMNDVAVNWKRINKATPRGEAVADDRAYTVEEARAVAGDTDPRVKNSVLLLASSGIRGGALDGLKVGHLKPVDRGGKVVAVRVEVYAGSEEKHITFATPEFWSEYQRYVEIRRKRGERVGPESPAFILERLGPRHGKGPTPMKSTVLRSLLDLRLRRLGFREGFVQGSRGKRKPDAPSDGPGGERRSAKRTGRRHEFQILHGFRKFFETQCLRAGLLPYTVDKLLGHGMGLHKHYDRRSEDELLDQYLKAVPHLTVLNPPPIDQEQAGLVKALEGRVRQLEADHESFEVLFGDLRDVLKDPKRAAILAGLLREAKRT